MSHVRVALYPIDAAKTEELVAGVDAELIEQYRAQPGFEGISVVVSDRTVASISRWDTREHAEEGPKVGIAWAQKQDGITGPPTAAVVGEERNSA